MKIIISGLSKVITPLPVEIIIYKGSLKNNEIGNTAYLQ
jgi:hypothetical protein